MKRLLFLALTSLFLSLPLFAQQEEDTENGVVSLAGREGYAIQTKSGDFVFKPYMMVQTAGHYNWYDDEGLDKAYNQDNIMNSGFSIPYAIIGFTGKAFDKVTFNLSINASASGARILQQAWFDVRLWRSMALRTGKFKTPFQNGFLTTLGNTLMPCVPSSMTTTVIMPYVLNAVTPSIMTGWDIGVELHGLLGGKFGYEVGLWNGTGSSTNSATKTVSDDWHIPSLLYAGRLSYMPLGLMPSTQGDPNRLNDNKILLAASGSVNVESEFESTNDTRAGLEAALALQAPLPFRRSLLHAHRIHRPSEDRRYLRLLGCLCTVRILPDRPFPGSSPLRLHGP